MKRGHLPLFGVGPIYVFSIVFTTVLFVVLTRNGLFSNCFFSNILFIVFGIFLIVVGVYLHIASVIFSKLHSNIKKNELIVTGVYSYVRNPVYSSALFVCSGIIFINGNVCLFVLPILYWLFMTILMIKTEEKWLYKLYGKKYELYCKEVNRCIPWFRKK
jgi:protein-S-isoprenylcysteine O-methyltransferase Ste14